MGFSDYMLPTGDRDDYDAYGDNEYKFIANIKPKQSENKTQPQVKEKVQYKRDNNKTPKAFSTSYYIANAQKSEQNSFNEKLWSCLLEYSQAVFELYKAVVKEFNNKLTKPIELPEYIADEEYLGLEIRADELYSAEQKLVELFKRYDVLPNKKISAHNTLQNLRKYAAQTWMLYDNLKSDNYFKNMVEQGEKYNELDLTQEHNVVRAFRGHKKVENFINDKIVSYFSQTGKSPAKRNRAQSLSLYTNINPQELLQDFVKSFNGYPHIEKAKEILPLVDKLQSKEALKVVNFYKHYSDLKFVYKKLRYKYNNINENTDFVLYYYDSSTGKERDLYETAKFYLKEVLTLKQLCNTNSNYSYLKDDLAFFEEHLTQTIEYNTEFHAKALKAEQDMLNNNPALKRRFENNEMHSNPFEQ